MVESKPLKRLMLFEGGSEIGEKENLSEEEKKQNELYAAAKWQKSCSGDWEEKPDERQKTPGSEDWDRIYSYEEKRLKSYIEGEKYGDWEKQNRSWELENGLVPLPDEEEKKLKESYIKERENWRLGLSKETFFPFGPGWELAYHTKLPKCSTVELPPAQARQRVPPSLEDMQYLCQKQQPTPVISWEDDREKLAAEGRCLDGSYLTPYCKCDRKCYRFDTVLEDDPPEYLPIWLAYCRQYRQSHCFDIDDFIGGRVCPLRPYQNFNGRVELMMELANLAIQEYNEKECNVFKYKVMKIEKANCCEATTAYWMTVKVSNLTLGSVIETFQIHAGVRIVTQKKIIFCCRPKEEVITGLPLCEFCFGLLPGEGKEP